MANILLLSSYSLVPISPYDSSANKAITKLHKQTAEFFAESSKAAEPGCGYSYHLPFYQNSKVSISSLLVWARATADNNLTVSQLELLSSSYAGLAQLHQLGCFTPTQVSELWVSFDASFSAILKLEL
ncbi:MAG: hypothetical protein OSB34_12080, partial [Planktomarina sp.]|nr:hypothetical protein [Planktomarina sp.]